MSLKLKKLNLVYRKLKISDFEEFRKLFYHCFKKKVSFDFYKWRYFSDKFSFCYGAFSSTKLIANVGMISTKLNYKKKERIYSRHSSMVAKNYRSIGIFSNLQNQVKKNISRNVRIVIMWPNINNLANFGLKKKNIIQKKFYIYRTFSKIKDSKTTKNYPIEQLLKYKNFFFKNNNSFFYKNLFYFKKRYLFYQNDKYLINKFIFKKFKSFFIIKCNKDNSGKNYVILDHFGSKEIIYKHLSNLIIDQNKLIFLSKRKIVNSNFKFINFVNFKIGFINNYNVKEKKLIMLKKDIFLGDTDIFINT